MGQREIIYVESIGDARLTHDESVDNNVRMLVYYEYRDGIKQEAQRGPSEHHRSVTSHPLPHVASGS